MKKAIVELSLQDIEILEIALEHVSGVFLPSHYGRDSISYSEIDPLEQKIAIAKSNIKAQKNDY